MVCYGSTKNCGLYSKQMALEDSPLSYLAHCCARANKETSSLSGIDVTNLIQICKQLIGKMAL